MNWWDELRIRHASRAAHSFVLHLNPYDLHFRGKDLYELNGFLLRESPFKDAEFVAFFRRGIGITFADEETEQRFLNFLRNYWPEKSNPKQIEPDEVNKFINNRRDISYMRDLFSKVLPIGWNDPSERMEKTLKNENVFPKGHAEKCRAAGAPFFAAVIDYADSLAPAEAKNFFILTTENLGASAEELASDTHAVMPVEIPFTTMEDRLQTLEVLKERYAPAYNLGISVEEAARISGGLSRRNLKQVVLETITGGKNLLEEDIFERKKKHLKERARDLAEAMRSFWGFDAVGGLKPAIRCLEEVADNMLKGDVLRCPQGILFSGPPGTGKTVTAQALAFRSRLFLIRLLNLMNRFVGQSEENQKFIFKLIVSHAPMIGVIDECEQLLPARGSYYSGDAAVLQRQERGFLDLTSDTDLRGLVLWVFITNRPQDLDSAFIRQGRMDLVIPFFDPSEEERGKILWAILHKMECQAAVQKRGFEHRISPAFEEEFTHLTHGHFKPGQGWLECTEDLDRRDKQSIKGFVGSECEAVIQLAHWSAQRQGRWMTEDDIRQVARHEFVPNRNMLEFEEAIDATLRHCNIVEFVPERYRERMREVRGRPESRAPTGQYL